MGHISQLFYTVMNSFASMKTAQVFTLKEKMEQDNNDASLRRRRKPEVFTFSESDIQSSSSCDRDHDNPPRRHNEDPIDVVDVATLRSHLNAKMLEKRVESMCNDDDIDLPLGCCSQ